MYVPAPFAVGDAETWDMLARARLGALVTHGPEGLSATHLPFVLDRERGVLIGHLARANPHASAAVDGEALVIFQGADAYVSPSLYPSKAENGRAVPTWNYEAVHVRGQLTWFSEPERLRDVFDRVSARFEAPRPVPWTTADAPAEYVARLLTAIVGLELAVTSVTAKRKLSQNQPAANFEGVHAGLAAGDHGDRAVATLMRGLA